MKKLIITFCLLLITTLSFFVAGYYVMFDYGFTGSYTKAVCNGNLCADYEFTCFDGIVTESKRISGFVVFENDWVDLRTNLENKC